MYPDVDVPVVEMDLGSNRMPETHLEVARELNALGGSYVLIIGSGHTVQGLRMVAWGRAN